MIITAMKHPRHYHEELSGGELKVCSLGNRGTTLYTVFIHPEKQYAECKVRSRYNTKWIDIHRAPKKLVSRALRLAGLTMEMING